MTFATSIFNAPFEVQENEVPIFIIENHKMFRDFVLEMFDELEGIKSDHLFFFGDKQLNLHKDLELITDFFKLDINKTRNITKLHNFLKNDYSNEELYEQTKTLSAQIINYLQMLLNNIDYDLVFNDDIDIVTLFKGADLRFDIENGSMLEKLIDYVKITNSFFAKKVFVLVGFKNLFNEHEQKEFYKFLQYEKINVFLVESIEPTIKNDCEIYRIIDKDLCVIY